MTWVYSTVNKPKLRLAKRYFIAYRVCFVWDGDGCIVRPSLHCNITLSSVCYMCVFFPFSVCLKSYYRQFSTITLNPSVGLAELQTFMVENGITFPSFPSSDAMSVAGLIATGSHVSLPALLKVIYLKDKVSRLTINLKIFGTLILICVPIV